MFRVRWYGYRDAESTWEPAHHIDYNTVVRYCRKKADTNSRPGALAATRRCGTRKLAGLDPGPVTPAMSYESSTVMPHGTTRHGPANRHRTSRPDSFRRFDIFNFPLFLDGGSISDNFWEGAPQTVARADPRPGNSV